MYQFNSVLLLLLISFLIPSFNTKEIQQERITSVSKNKRDLLSDMNSLSTFIQLKNVKKITSSNIIITYPIIPFFKPSLMFKLTANKIPISVSTVATFQTSYLSAKPNSLVTITVTYLLGSTIDQYSLLPINKDIKSSIKISGNQIKFQILSPKKLELRINDAVTIIGDTSPSKILYIIVDLPQIKSEIPGNKNGDKDTLYFGPGIHNLGYKMFDKNHLPPKRIYAAPGALINAAWSFVGVSNVVISGRGFFRNYFQDKSHNLFYFAGCQNIVMKDISVIDSPQHVIVISSGSVGLAISSHFLIDNIKSLHRGGNSDGYSFFGPVNNVVVSNTLLINMDNQIVLQAGLPSGPFDNTFSNNIFVKPNSAGNFMMIQSPPKAQGYRNSIHGTIGANNRFLSFNILRLSGEESFILYSGSNAIEEIIFDNLKIQTFLPRPTSSPSNFFLHFSNDDTAFEKFITFRNIRFPAFPDPFSGSVILGNWKIKFEGVFLNGEPLIHDKQIGLKRKGERVITHYSS